MVQPITMEGAKRQRSSDGMLGPHRMSQGRVTCWVRHEFMQSFGHAGPSLQQLWSSAGLQRFNFNFSCLFVAKSRQGLTNGRYLLLQLVTESWPLCLLHLRYFSSCEFLVTAGLQLQHVQSRFTCLLVCVECMIIKHELVKVVALHGLCNALHCPSLHSQEI